MEIKLLGVTLQTPQFAGSTATWRNALQNLQEPLVLNHRSPPLTPRHQQKEVNQLFFKCGFANILLACQFFCQFFHFSWFSAAVLDCKTGNGETYRGPTSVTVLGVTCQAWSAQTPHEHSSFTPETHANKGLEGNVSVWVLLYKHFGERAELFVFFSSHLTLPLCPLSELQKPRR